MLNLKLIVGVQVTELIKMTVEAAPLAGNVNVPIRLPVCAAMLSQVGTSLVTPLTVSVGRLPVMAKTLILVFPVVVAPEVPLNANWME